ncbi:flagellar hook protein FlgE [Modicisalibacter muralis]|uniref:Flagellar hook protein FlgE n=1 Tax=Modicisalibacter muralis TaxID=119000 RepID=A0A1G9FT21_9GAMM|nr:flagellar hook protein FlgE [Halomonas muralis]SDK91530.1 flagellar hook protein FlgE [Halomonas muralis]
MGFSQALSGLNAAADKLNVVGNNIANSQTVGFKSSTVQFADVYAGSKIGLGTKVSAVLQDFSNGSLETTGRNLDLAIAGDGFFRFVQNDQVVYSRNGQLTVTAQGYLENAQGARLTGFPAGVGTGGQPVELQVPTEALAAKGTTGIDASLNLNSSVDAIDRATTAFDITDPDSYSYANSATVYDSLGNSHNVTMYFTKTGANAWEVRTALDGTVNANVENITFDQDGILQTTAPGTFTFTSTNGAADVTFDLDLAGTTQFGNEFELSSLTQDGYTSGSLVGTVIDDNGNIIGNYSNEQSQVLGTIALANFRNPEGLQPVGDNAWAETGASGQALLGLGGSGVFGSVESGVVETSNVDLTQALVDLIIAQRTFQANSQTVKVQDEVLQGIVNL